MIDRMNRITDAWFEFKGLRSDQMGIALRQMATRFVPGVEVKRKKVAGRDGDLKYGPRTRNSMQVRIECDVRDERRIADAIAWLSGDGPLRFSDEPGFVYEASIEKEYSRAPIMARYKGQRFVIVWTCEPFRKLYAEATPIRISASGTTISNPGTAESLPRIEITGNGDFSLTIGGQTAYFQGVQDGIIIDSELGDALTKDGAALANNWMDGPLFKIQPGASTVSWTTGGEDDEGNATEGRISAVKILPRWRWI